jgi:hypothetical protein
MLIVIGSTRIGATCSGTTDQANPQRPCLKSPKHAFFRFFSIVEFEKASQLISINDTSLLRTNFYQE